MTLRARVLIGLIAALVIAVVAMTAIAAAGASASWAAPVAGAGIVVVTVVLVAVPLASLANGIREMSEEIERLAENQKHLLQAVSHELRTPTARIRFSLEMLESDDDDASRSRRIEEIDHNLTELDSLVDELLTFVRFDEDEAPALKTERIEIPALVAELVEETRVLGDRIQVGVVAHGDPAECRIVANRRYVRRAIDNLLRNAIRHADNRVSLEYQRVGDQVLLFVNDDGAGIPEAERDRVWEPFARVDLSRSRDSGGFGLGLAIVRRIMAWHGGRAHVEESLLGGAMFVTNWPVDPDLLDDEIVDEA